MKNVNLWGGQFKPAQEGLFKSAKGGLYDRIFHIDKEYSQKAEIKATSVDKIRGNTSEREVNPDNDKKNKGMYL